MGHRFDLGFQRSGPQNPQTAFHLVGACVASPHADFLSKLYRAWQIVSSPPRRGWSRATLAKDAPELRRVAAFRHESIHNLDAS